MRRGQATVELGLGLLVFVTVLLFGIHFAEVGWLSLKVQEAGAWAVWESTGRKVQDIAGRNTSDFNKTLAPGGIEGLTKARYEDFDGLSSGSGSTVITAALTRGSGLEVECLPDTTLSFRPTSTVANAKVYFDQGGLSCQVKARLDGVGIPKRFLQQDEGGFFSAEHKPPTPYYFCAVGRPNGTSCKGRLSILTNDWGLAGNDPGDDQSASCRIGSFCGNLTYQGAVKAMWVGGGGAGKAFAEAHAGTAPTHANEFFFSYSGWEFGYFTELPDERVPRFKTGGPGMGQVPDSTLHNCFLGKAGCP